MRGHPTQTGGIYWACQFLDQLWRSRQSKRQKAESTFKVSQSPKAVFNTWNSMMYSEQVLLLHISNCPFNKIVVWCGPSKQNVSNKDAANSTKLSNHSYYIYLLTSKVLINICRREKTTSKGSHSDDLSESDSVLSFSKCDAGQDNKNKEPQQHKSHPALSRTISTLTNKKEDSLGQRREGEFQVTYRDEPLSIIPTSVIIE